MTRKFIAIVQYTEAVLAQIVVRYFLRPTVSGLGNLQQLVAVKQERGHSVVIIANHINDFDPLYISMVMSEATGSSFYPVWLPAKKRFFNTRLKDMAMTCHGCLPIGIGKDEDSLRSLKTIIEKVKAGDTVCVFPEGQVSPDGQMGKDLGFITFLARRSSLIVLPVHLSGLYGLKVEWQEMFLRRRRLGISFGTPLLVEKGDAVDSIALIAAAKPHI